MINYTTSKPPFQPLRAFKTVNHRVRPATPYQIHLVNRDTNTAQEVCFVSAAELRALRDEIDALLAEVGG